MFAIIIGFIPALIWLWFWLKEDKKHPEPKRIIAFTFIAGMVSTIAALVGEQAVYYISKDTIIMTLSSGLVLLFIFALIEEVVKYLAAWRALRLPDFNEPIDAVIYLITAGLGFATLENIIFLLNTFLNDGIILGFMNGNMRFLGATLLHSATSAIVGLSIGFTYYQKKQIKVINNFIGILLATTLHALFNFYIITIRDNAIFKVFAILWLVVLIIILLFEHIKKIKEKL